MTKITIDHVKGTWCAEGHSGYADAGSDIVCAAVSVLSDLMSWAALMTGGTFRREDGVCVTRGTDERYCFMLKAAAWAAAQLSEQYPENAHTEVIPG